MSQLISQVHSLLDNLKSGKAVTNSHFAIARDHVDNGKDLGGRFREKHHYFQVIINQMHLVNQRNWFVQYDPMVFAASSFIYETKTKTTPFVVGPSMLAQHKQAIHMGRDTHNRTYFSCKTSAGRVVLKAFLDNRAIHPFFCFTHTSSTHTDSLVHVHPV